MTVVTENLLSSRIRDEFELIHVDTSDHRGVDNVGRLDIRNAFLALAHAVKLSARLARRPDLAYVPIARNRLGVLRDALLLLPMRIARIPVVIHFHSRDFDRYLDSEPFWMHWIIGACFSQRVHVIVLSESMKGGFDVLASAERIHVVPNGIPELEGDREAVRDPNPLILHLGTMWSEKGVFDVLEAVRRMHGGGLQVKLVLAGGWYVAEERARAEAFVRHQGIQEWVRITGPVNGPEKARLLRSAWVMAFPSRFDAHPIVVLEALSAGVPVVATRIGALPEMIEAGEEGALTEPGDVDALTNALTKMVSNADELRRMSRRARIRYEREFTLDRFASNVGAVWRIALGSTAAVKGLQDDGRPANEVRA